MKTLYKLSEIHLNSNLLLILKSRLNEGNLII